MNTKEFTDMYYTDRRGTGCCKWDDLQQQFGHSEMIAMWVADMDFRVPQAVTEALAERVRQGVFGYTIPQPSSYLKAFCHWEEHRHGVILSPEQIRYSPGVVSAIHRCIQAFTEENDSIIINTPVYYPFARAVRTLRRNLICNELICTEGKYTIDMAAFEAQIRENSVRMFILCSPHNPVGRVWRWEELETLFAICAKYDVMILSDEIHQDFVYGAHRHTASFLVGEGRYRDRLVLLTSASKTFNLAGLKNAFVVIPSDDLRRHFDEFSLTVSDNEGCIFGYTATEAAYRYGEEWLTDLKAVIFENYEYASERFQKELPQAVVSPLEGTYLMWVDLGAYVTPETIEEVIRDRALVAVDFGSWFSDSCPTCIRLNLATSMEHVKNALDAIFRQILSARPL